MLLAEQESRVKAAGASCVELKAVKDEMHERYYGKTNYYIMKSDAGATVCTFKNPSHHWKTMSVSAMIIQISHYIGGVQNG